MTSIRKRIVPGAGTVAALALAGMLAGCASTQDGGGEVLATVFADPGEYRYYSCVQLAQVHRAQSQRRAELWALMVRAERAPGGVLASTVAYRGDYLATTGRLKYINEARRDRDCDREDALEGRPPLGSPAARDAGPAGPRA